MTSYYELNGGVINKREGNRNDTGQLSNRIGSASIYLFLHSTTSLTQVLQIGLSINKELKALHY